MHESYIFLNSYTMPTTRIKRPELLAEQGKYRLRLQRSPCQHKETADHDQAKQEDGTLDRQLGVPWFYLHHGHCYKRALSGLLLITSGFDNSNPEAQQNRDRQGRDAPASEDTEDASLDGSYELTEWVGCKKAGGNHHAKAK